MAGSLHNSRVLTSIMRRPITKIRIYAFVFEPPASAWSCSQRPRSCTLRDFPAKDWRERHEAVPASQSPQVLRTMERDTLHIAFNGEWPDLESERQVGRRAYFIDDTVPTPDQDARVERSPASTCIALMRARL